MEERVCPVEEPEELLRLGAALDDVKGRADSAVHHQPAVPVDSVRAIVNDVIAFSDALRAQRDPEAARLEPYTEELNRFLREALGLGITE